MNLKNELLKHCSIKNVLIILCILILLYLIYETYVVRENFTGFDDFINTISGISQDTNVDDYSKLDMEAICKQADKLNKICTQCNKTDNTQICFPPDIENNCAYKDLYEYDNDYIADDVGKHFGETSYSNITKTDSDNNSMYKCKLKYAPVDTVELNCDGALKNATLSGCGDVLTLKYKDVEDSTDMIPSPEKSAPLNFFPDESLEETSGNILSSGEKYFPITEHTNVHRIIIDISNTNITDISKIHIGDNETKFIEINDQDTVGTLVKATASGTDTTLTEKLNVWNDDDTIPNGVNLFLYQKKDDKIALKLYTIGTTTDTTKYLFEEISLKNQFGQTENKLIKITFNTDDGTTTSKLYLFQDPSTPVE